MADMTDTYGYHGHFHHQTQIADLRREVAVGDGQIRADVNLGFERTNESIKATGWQVSEKVSAEADRLASIANQNFISTQDKFFALQKDVLEDGAKTRELINSTTQADLRMQVLDARNRAERCVPRCCSDSRGNDRD